MAELLKKIRGKLYNRFPQLSSVFRRASCKPADIFVEGLLERMERRDISLDEAYQQFMKNIKDKNARESLRPAKTAYQSLKKR